jgi:Domain of unknown function (DUF5615)
MLALYIDHNVPFPIVAGLRKRGVDVITCLDDNTTTLDDESLLDRALALGRVIFSQDEDFLVIAQNRQQTGREFAGVAYSQQLAISIGNAVRDLELLAKVYDLDDMRNRVEYLPYSRASSAFFWAQRPPVAIVMAFDRANFSA